MTTEPQPNQSSGVEITCKILNKKGIHARSAAQIVKCAQNFDADITVCYGEYKVNAQSILGLMMLGAKRGDSLLLKGTGTQSTQALEALATLMENRFGEE